MPIVLKSGSLNLLEPSGPVQVCNESALPYDYIQIVNKIPETRAGSNFAVEEPRQHGVINHSTKI
jgi:hypothetical protein